MFNSDGDNMYPDTRDKDKKEQERLMTILNSEKLQKEAMVTSLQAENKTLLQENKNLRNDYDFNDNVKAYKQSLHNVTMRYEIALKLLIAKVKNDFKLDDDEQAEKYINAFIDQEIKNRAEGVRK